MGVDRFVTVCHLHPFICPGAAEMYQLEVGDHAIAEQIVPCGMCRMCNKGSYNMCEYQCM